jgi:AcrR family transcriptional regulator
MIPGPDPDCVVSSPPPSRPSRTPSAEMHQNQRRRMVAAAARALAEHGYADITVAQITAYARVSRSTFYENFKNRQDCVLNAHQEIFERFIACLSEACAGEAEWTDRVTASIGVGLAYMAANPDEACMLTLDSRTADTLLARRVAASRDHLASLLRACRDALPPATPSPQVTELALIGAISAVSPIGSFKAMPMVSSSSCLNSFTSPWSPTWAPKRRSGSQPADREPYSFRMHHNEEFGLKVVSCGSNFQ